MTATEKEQLVALLRCQISPHLSDAQRLGALETLREAERHPTFCRLLLEVWPLRPPAPGRVHTSPCIA